LPQQTSFDQQFDMSNDKGLGVGENEDKRREQDSADASSSSMGSSNDELYTVALETIATSLSELEDAEERQVTVRAALDQYFDELNQDINNFSNRFHQGVAALFLAPELRNSNTNMLFPRTTIESETKQDPSPGPDLDSTEPVPPLRSPRTPSPANHSPDHSPCPTGLWDSFSPQPSSISSSVAPLWMPPESSLLATIQRRLGGMESGGSTDSPLVGAIRMSRNGAELASQNIQPTNQESDHVSSTDSSEASRNDILVEARLVGEEDNDDLEAPQPSSSQSNEIVVAEPVGPKVILRDAWNSRAAKFIDLMVILVIAGLSGGTSCLLSDSCHLPLFEKSGREYDPNDPITMQNLPSYTLQALRDTSSPQSKAFQWSQEDVQWLEQSSYIEAKILQRFALAVFYFSTQGDAWKNSTSWLAHEVDECNWFSLSKMPHICNNGTAGMIEYLGLRENFLEGSLPPEIGLLEELKGIDLAGNLLQGAIPSQIGLLSNLETIDLGENMLVHALPSELGQLSQLRSLHVNENELSRTLPSELGLMNGLRQLSLAQNRLIDTLPTELGMLHNTLEWLYLQDNHITGSMISELGQLTELRGLWLNRNYALTGKIPTEVTMLAQLETLSLGNNLLRNTLPSNIDRMTKLEWLQLNGNQLSGSIPSEIGRLSNTLVYLDLDDNQVTGRIPTEIGQLEQLAMLLLADNNLTGEVPTELAQLKSITDINLSGNPLFGGTIPDSLCELFVTGELMYLSIDDHSC
jgi:hypothetical protein